MSSTVNNEVKFSLVDFEKGLMLIGLISPLTTEELEEKNELELYEKSLSKDRSRIYFKRAVLAAEIVTKLREERTFGRVKFQKLVYICEHISQMNLTTRYAKQAAGPFDNKFMHSINKEFEKQKWFNVIIVEDGNFKVPKYLPLENQMAYKSYYSNLFSSHDQQIQSTIELFRNTKTEETELAATVLACVIELVRIDNIVKRESLLDVFYNWHDKKKRFRTSQIFDSLDWLNKNSLLPLITLV